MNKEEIVGALETLNALLRERGIKGEICLYGGAAMCLAFDARQSTKDVDAIFHPSTEVRAAAAETARRLGLPVDWLNDGVKGFLVDHPRRAWKSMSNLTVLVAEADYLFAMKAMSARVDTSDRDDIRRLLTELGVLQLDDALTIVEKYYPRNQIKPATLFFLEELFDESDNP